MVEKEIIWTIFVNRFNKNMIPVGDWCRQKRLYVVLNLKSHRITGASFKRFFVLGRTCAFVL